MLKEKTHADEMARALEEILSECYDAKSGALLRPSKGAIEKGQKALAQYRSVKHGYSGSCSPGAQWVGQTFSYGIFEMVPAKTPTGWKKGPVKVRVSGPVSQAEAVKAKAEEIVAALDAGQYVGPKKVKV